MFDLGISGSFPIQAYLLFLRRRYLVQRGHADSLACPRGGLWSSLPLLLLDC